MTFGITWDPEKTLFLGSACEQDVALFRSGQHFFSNPLKVSEKKPFKRLNEILPALMLCTESPSIYDYFIFNRLQYFEMVRIHRKTYDLGTFFLMDDEIERVGRFISVERKEPGSEDEDDSGDDDVVVESENFTDFLSPLLRDRRHGGCAIQKIEETYLEIVLAAAAARERK